MRIIDYELMIINEGPVVNFWVETFHLGRNLTLSEFRKTYLEFKKFEKEIDKIKSIHGWITWVNHEHPHIQKMVQKVGGKLYTKERQRAWYVKFKEGI